MSDILVKSNVELCHPILPFIPTYLRMVIYAFQCTDRERQ